ncbi:uncharacterized protein B0H18DRAFT_886800, partial [Fomitopsis serialis]|uniref:uncharacterized protein n=1 Tax=Fomitopsis serialis TaxID=139415 RepID=UPI002007524F
EYDDLRMDAEVLPGNASSLVHPFLSLVVNLNVATLAHRDKQDKSLCVVLAVESLREASCVCTSPAWPFLFEMAISSHFLHRALLILTSTLLGVAPPSFCTRTKR